MDRNKMNYVFSDVNSTIPLTPAQLVEACHENGLKGITIHDYPSRILGDLCDCAGPGEFVLEPPEQQQKRYMCCRKCGCCSHL
jgi:hypothetical protein